MANIYDEYVIPGCEITGVKRLSDGKVFTVGQMTGTWNFIKKITMYKQGDIIKFALHVGSGAGTKGIPCELDNF